jgi:hypothetical protein
MKARVSYVLTAERVGHGSSTCSGAPSGSASVSGFQAKAGLVLPPSEAKDASRPFSFSAASPVIPTYSSAGVRLRDRSLESIENLLSLSHVVVRRDSKGRIRSAFFRPASGANPMRLNALMGQKYSYLERVGDRRAWSHRSLLQKQDIEALTGVPVDSEAEVDLYVRGVFRNVALSVMAQPAAPVAPPPAPAKAKVIPFPVRKPAAPGGAVRLKEAA